MKKNYVILNENGIIRKHYIANLIATSANVDVICFFADFDQEIGTTTYRCSARIKRSDGFVVGPVSLQAGVVTPEEATKFGVEYLACRQLTLTKTMMAVQGPIEITAIYEEIDAYGYVVSSMATSKVVADVMEAVESILTEEELAEFRAQFLPRDLSEITVAQNLDDATLILGQQDGLTKRIGMLLVKQYLQESTVINIGVASIEDLDAVTTKGIYRLELIGGAVAYSAMLFVNSDYSQCLLTGGKINYRVYNEGAGTYVDAWTTVDILDVTTRLGITETEITKIKNGTTTVGKATQDASGNNIALTYETKNDATTHKNATNNPHSVTKAHVGLDNVTNDQQATKVEFDAYVLGAAVEINKKYDKTVVDGLLLAKADLVDGKVPAAQLPSYVDDVLEYDNLAAFPATGEAGKIYVAKDTNKTYRWSGSTYAVISETLALGETSSTAYAGDKGKTNADNITALSTSKEDKSNKKTSLNDNSDEYYPTQKAVKTITDQKVDKVAGKSLVADADITQITTNKTDITLLVDNKVDKNFSAYPDGVIEDTDLILLNKAGVHKKNTIAALSAKIAAETGTFVASADYSAQGLGAAKAVKDGDGNVIKDSYLKKGTAKLDITKVASYTSDTNPINETVKLVSLEGKTSLKQLVKNGNFVNTTNWSLSGGDSLTVANNICDYTTSAQYQHLYQNANLPTSAHKYLITCDIKLASGSTNVYFGYGDPAYVSTKCVAQATTNTTEWQHISKIGAFVELPSSGKFFILDTRSSGYGLIQIKNVMVIDLTELGLDTTLTTTTLFETEYPNLTYFEGIKNSSPTQIISKSNNLFDKSTVTTVIDEGYNVRIVASSNPLVISGAFKSNTQYTVKFRFKKVGTNNLGITFNYTDGTNFTDYKVGTVYTQYTGTSVINKTLQNITLFTGGTSVNITVDDFQLNEGSTALAYQPYAVLTTNIPQATLDLYPNGMGRLPNGVSDELIEGKSYSKKTLEYTLQASDIIGLITTQTNYDRVLITKPLNYIRYNVAGNDIANTLVMENTLGNKIHIDNDISMIGFVSENYSNIQIGYNVAKGTYANLTAAQTALIGTKILYQLATAVTTDLTTIGGNFDNTINAYDKGTITVDNGLINLEIPVDITAQVNTNTDQIRANKADITQAKADILTKVDKITGKGLSTEDYTTAEKTKLGGIESGAQVNVIEDVKDYDGVSLSKTEKVVTIRKATTSVSGLASPELVTQVETNKTDIAGLKGAVIPRGDIVATSAEVTANTTILDYRIDELYYREPAKGDMLKDSNRAEWYYDGTTWNNQGQDIIASATSTNEGVIQLGYTETNGNLAVKTSSKKAYVQLTKGAIESATGKLESVLWTGNLAVTNTPTDPRATPTLVDSIFLEDYDTFKIEWAVNSKGSLFTEVKFTGAGATNAMTLSTPFIGVLGILDIYSFSCWLMSDGTNWRYFDFNFAYKTVVSGNGNTIADATIYIKRIIGIKY